MREGGHFSLFIIAQNAPNQTACYYKG